MRGHVKSFFSQPLGEAIDDEDEEEEEVGRHNQINKLSKVFEINQSVKSLEEEEAGSDEPLGLGRGRTPPKVPEVYLLNVISFTRMHTFQPHRGREEPETLEEVSEKFKMQMKNVFNPAYHSSPMTRTKIISPANRKSQGPWRRLVDFLTKIEL